MSNRTKQQAKGIKNQEKAQANPNRKLHIHQGVTRKSTEMRLFRGLGAGKGRRETFPMGNTREIMPQRPISKGGKAHLTHFNRADCVAREAHLVTTIAKGIVDGLHDIHVDCGANAAEA